MSIDNNNVNIEYNNANIEYRKTGMEKGVIGRVRRPVHGCGGQNVVKLLNKTCIEKMVTRQIHINSTPQQPIRFMRHEDV